MRRLYLAEDQELLNSALKMLLDLEDDFEVVGTSLTGEDVAKQIMDLKVDVALLDIEMPKQSGLEIAKELAQRLFLSEGTVRNYISSILSKTGTASRLEALNLARDKGWI